MSRDVWDDEWLVAAVTTFSSEFIIQFCSQAGQHRAQSELPNLITKQQESFGEKLFPADCNGGRLTSYSLKIMYERACKLSRTFHPRVNGEFKTIK